MSPQPGRSLKASGPLVEAHGSMVVRAHKHSLTGKNTVELEEFSNAITLLERPSRHGRTVVSHR